MSKEIDPIKLFGDYMKLTGTPSLKEASGSDPVLSGKRLGVVNAGSWVSLWSTYFGQKMLPGVKIINSSNEAVQLNFMKAYHEGLPCPPQINIDLFCKHAEDLYKLYNVDAILISCSTMNRAFAQVSNHMKQFDVPVVQIDEAMMEEAVNSEGKILVIATHGPTVKNTQDLLLQTANRLGKKVEFTGATIEEAFDMLGEGDIVGHNQAIADVITEKTKEDSIDLVVLAQLSMSIFNFSYPNPESSFGVKVLTSGETGFARVGKVLSERGN